VLGKRRVEWVLRLLIADAAVLLASFLGAYGLRVLLNRPLDREAGPLTHYLWLLGLIVPVWLGLLAFMGGYGVGWTARSRARLFVRVSGIGLLLLGAALFLERGGQQINRSLVALFAAVSGLGLWAERGLVQAWLRRTRPGARWARVALVVGTGAQASRLIAALRQYPEAGWVVRGCVSMDPSDPARAVEGTPVIGSLAELPDVLQADEVVDEVFFAVPPDRLSGLAEALDVCESFGVDTRVLVDLHRPARAHPFVEELFSFPFYGFSPTLTRQGVLAAKRLLDLVIASVLVIAALPFLVAIGLLVKLTSPGPVLFRQERAGFHGRRFWMYKFRTMIHGAEDMREQVAHLNEMTGPVFKASGDPRLTGVGRLLRRGSLDELPQLLNVLKGEMSLVGPRPLPLYEAKRIRGAQRRRLAMRPGITGLWQVSGRSMVNFDAWMRLDLRYVDQWSLALDLKILLRTIPVVLRGEGAS
jgi:exopolysaccharide biosynthesis polyprenyl glycosylphosphotransferase